MINQSAATVKTRIDSFYEKEASEKPFRLLAAHSNNSISVLQVLFQGVEPHLGAVSADYICEKLRFLFGTPLFTRYFMKDASYLDVIKPLISYYLSFSTLFPEKPQYPNVPMKTVYEPDRINLHELNITLTRDLLRNRRQSRSEVSYNIYYIEDCFLLFTEQCLGGYNTVGSVVASLTFFLSRLRGPKEEADAFVLLVKILLSFSRNRDVPWNSLFLIFKRIIENKHITSRELICILYDFYIDDRYSAKHLLSLFSLISTCVKSFYPRRKALIPAILNLLKDFIRISHSGSSRYLKTIFELYTRNPHLDLSDWVEEGARIIREHGDQSKSAKAFFEKESDLSQRIWREIDSGIYFDQVVKRLQFFVNAITEGNVQLRKSEHFPLSDRSAVYYTDGKSIFIPEYVNYVKDRDKNYMVLLHSVAHECAHIEFGSFEKNRERYRTASRELNALFPGQFHKNKKILSGYIESVREQLAQLGYSVRSIRTDPDYASYLTRLLFHVEFPFLLNDVWNILEDFRVNRLLYEKYSGYKKEKELVDAVDFQNLPRIDELPPADQLVNGFIQSVWFGKQKGTLREEVAPFFTRMKDLFRSFSALDSPDVYDAIIYAATLYKILLRFMNRFMPECLKAAGTGGHVLHLTFEQAGINTEGRNATLQVEMESMKQTLRQKEGPNIDDKLEKGKANRKFRETTKEHMDDMERKELDEKSRIYLYPEWDIEKHCYMTDHCILGELSSTGRANDMPDNLHAPYSGYLESIKRAFLKMKPTNLIEHRGMDDGHEIDFDRYVDALMDFSSGNQMENNFYIYKERKHRSVLSSLVLDMSPSTEQMTEGGSIFLYQKYAVYLLSEAMHSIGDPFGIFSFFDYGPSATLFYTIKDFTENYSSQYYKYLAGFRPARRGFSRLSVGLRHLIAKMKDHEATSKIIFFITDGFPCYFEGTIDKGETATVFYVDGARRVEVDRPVPVVDAVYKPNPYVLHDLRKVYEEAVIAGINLFCITLDEDSVSFMEEVFGNALIYLPEIPELPKRLLEIFRKVTT